MPLSEGMTALTRGHNGPGVCVHSESNGAYVNLRIAMYIDLESNADQNPAVVDVPEERVTLRLAVGKQTHALIVPLHLDTRPCDVCNNLWVDGGQEVWISTSHPTRHIVYGFTSKTPR